MSEGYARLSLSALAGIGGFRADSRYGGGLPVTMLEPEPAAPLHLEPARDPVADAYTQGYAQALDDARLHAEAAAQADALAGEQLALSFARLDHALEEELRQRLRDTVVALCEAALAPLAIDEDALLHRVTRAAAMLARADDDRVIRLHPEDLKLVAPRVGAEWTVEPDPSLERGAIRVEGANGGVEDGPSTWRRAIAEALHAC